MTRDTVFFDTAADPGDVVDGGAFAGLCAARIVCHLGFLVLSFAKA
jgi:hypothetical protein